MADDPSDVAALLTVTPDEFVAARNALAKSLRGAGRKDDAAAVAALRRPTVVDWALNSVAAQSPAVVASASTAASRLREAQAAVLGDAPGGDVADLRAAMGAVRTAAAELRSAAEKVLRGAGRPASDLGALSARVNEVTVSDALLEQLGRSHLGMASVALDADDPFAAMTEVAPARRSQRPAKTTSKQSGGGSARHTDVPADREDRVETAAARRERERARAAARKSVEAAKRTLTRLERNADEADARLTAARAAADEAHDEADAARAELEAAELALTNLD